MTKYVAGFAFNTNLTQVALIRKQKPAWQKGKLNGIGGKVEQGEGIHYAMAREAREEAGLDCEWKRFASVGDHDNFIVDFFYAVTDLSQARTMESEEVSVYRVDELVDEDCIPNLRWLIPMALNVATGADKTMHDVVEWLDTP